MFTISLFEVAKYYKVSVPFNDKKLNSGQVTLGTIMSLFKRIN